MYMSTIDKREKKRLAALKKYNLVDHPFEEEFDEIINIAAEICEAPVAMLNIMGKHYQFTKSKKGIDINKIPREQSFCQHTISPPHQLLQIKDARKDHRFVDNPLVNQNPHLIFYAGIPLLTPNNFALGALCVTDSQPCQLTKLQENALQKLGKLCEKLLWRHRQRIYLLNKKTQLNKHLKSLRYAQEIQKSVLPNLSHVDQYFSDSFVLFLPANIVSGDFYWFYKTTTAEKVIIALGDCTGHGVPGGFLSIISNDLLNKIIIDEQTHYPSKILNKLNSELQQNLYQEDIPRQIPDGMDISLCSFDLKNNTLNYACANHKIIKIHNNNIEELAGNRQPIGGFWPEREPFLSRQIKIQRGDTFYLMSDGYSDQFGGKYDKKFRKKRLRELLMSISHRPLQEQKLILKETIQEWKETSNATQTDDITVMGFKI